MILDTIRAKRGAPLLWRLPSPPLTDSALSRTLLGIGLALFGVALSGLLSRWTDEFTALAVFTPCIAIAASIGGVTSGLACLFVSALALWLSAFFLPTGMQVSLLLIDGAVISGVAGAIGALRRRRTEEAIQRGETGLRLAIEIGGIGAFEFDPVNNSAALSGSARRIFGFSPDEKVAPGKVVNLIFDEDLAERQIAITAAAMDERGDGVYRAKYRIHRANDGALRWVSSRGKAFYRNGRMTHIVGINRDVTDEVDAERMLREKARLAEQLTGLATTLPGAIFSHRVRVDGSSYLPYAAPKIADVIGFGAEDLAVDMSVALSRVHIDDLMSVHVIIARAVNDAAPWRMRFRYHHPGKGLIWVEGEAAPQISGNGEVTWHGYLQDVTERQNATAALEASEEHLRAVFDGADDAIFTVDLDGKLTSMNAAGHHMFGYPADDLLGARVESLMPEPGFWLDAMAKPCLRREIQGRRKNGSLFPIHVTFSEIRTGEGDVFVGFARDLTEHHRIEAHIRLMSNERLDALETMASGLAHEVNQPLSASATFLKVARQMLDAPHDVRTGPSVQQVLEKAAAQIMRAGRIMTRVREFSTRGEPDKTYQHLHGLLTCVTRALSEDSRFSGFRLILSLEAENDRVIVDRLQISQVLVNLLHNAVQAMQDGPNRDIVVTTVSEGRSEIRVQIIDRGVGMSEETRKNLFEPFKTIKPSGMGIGLLVSRGIIESHFGKIWAEPNFGGGVIFNFTLPLLELESS